jgi:FtsH-binding integral membrane protein
MAFDFQNLLERGLEMATAGLLSVFGGTAAYVYKTVRDDTGFKFGQFLVNAFLAFFIGNMIGGFIPNNASYRDGLLMLAGFSTWPILGVMEFYGKKFVLKYIDRTIGTNIEGLDAELNTKPEEVSSK